MTRGPLNNNGNMLAQQAAQAGNAKQEMEKTLRYPASSPASMMATAMTAVTNGSSVSPPPRRSVSATSSSPQNATLVLNGGNNYSGIINFNGGNLNTLVEQGNSSVLVVDKSGKYRNVRLGDNGKLDAKKAEAMAADFNASGAILLSALLPQETGYWNPAVITGADGKATLTLNVPERSAAWKFLAKGLSAETLAGEASDDLLVKKDLFGEIKLPLAFTDGDTAEIPVTVHNDAVEKGTIEIVLRTTIGGRKVEETKRIAVTSKGLHEVSFKTELKRPVGWDKGASATAGPPDAAHGGPALAGSELVPPYSTPQIDVQFELLVRAAGHEDIVERSIPLKPYGVPVFHAASGSGTSDQTVWVDPPEGMPAESAGMQIIIGPTVQRSLMDIVLAPRRGASWKSAGWPPGWNRPPATRWPRWACKSCWAPAATPAALRRWPWIAASAAR